MAQIRRLRGAGVGVAVDAGGDEAAVVLAGGLRYQVPCAGAVSPVRRFGLRLDGLGALEEVGAVEDAGGVRDLVDIRGEQVREVIGVVQVAGVSRVGDHGVAGQWLALGPYPHAGGDIPILVPLPVYEQCGNRQPVVGSGSSAEVSSEVRMSTVSALVRWALTSMTYC